MATMLPFDAGTRFTVRHEGFLVTEVRRIADYTFILETKGISELDKRHSGTTIASIRSFSYTSINHERN